MKIGVLTFVSRDNAGTFMQALATIESLQKAVPRARVELIDISFRHAAPASVWRAIGKRGWVDPPFAMRVVRKVMVNAKLYGGLPRSPRCRPATYEEAVEFIDRQRYDAVIVGSDEVLRFHPVSDFYSGSGVPIAFLPPEVGAKKIMLSSSAAVSSWNSLKPEQRDRIRRSIREYHFVSARDQATFELLSHAAGTDGPRIVRMPDPTVSLATNRWADKARLPRCLRRRRRPVVAVRLPDTAWSRRIVFACSSRGFQPVSLLARIPGSCWLPPPMSFHDYPAMFRYFSVVLTSSFHETLFSLRNGIPVFGFDLYDHRYDEIRDTSKIKSLLEEYALDKHYLPREMVAADADAVVTRIANASAAFDPACTLAVSRQQEERYESAVRGIAGLLGEQMAADSRGMRQSGDDRRAVGLSEYSRG